MQTASSPPSSHFTPDGQSNRPIITFIREGEEHALGYSVVSDWLAVSLGSSQTWLTEGQAETKGGGSSSGGGRGAEQEVAEQEGAGHFTAPPEGCLCC